LFAAGAALLAIAPIPAQWLRQCFLRKRPGTGSLLWVCSSFLYHSEL
jgi:hypothetical protein